MSMRAVIEGIEKEMLNKAAREGNAEMVDAANLEGDSDSIKHYTEERMGRENET